jgi:polyisoprenoid-binding protein YceI
MAEGGMTRGRTTRVSMTWVLIARALLAASTLLVCALASAASIGGSPVAFRVDPDRTTARFAVASLGVEQERGRLGRTTGTILVDAERRVERVDFEIDTRAVDTGWDLRDAFLRSGVMFDTEHYPRMHFRSKRIVYEGARLAGIEGNVTLRDVTHAARFDVVRLQCMTRDDAREACEAEVVGRISRVAFGMDFAYPLIGDDVELQFVVTAIREGDADDPRQR